MGMMTIRVGLGGFFLFVFGGNSWSFWVGAGVLVWRRPGSGGRGPVIFLPVFVLSPLDPSLWFKLRSMLPMKKAMLICEIAYKIERGGKCLSGFELFRVCFQCHLVNAVVPYA
jgi:hypothetical protein